MIGARENDRVVLGLAPAGTEGERKKDLGQQFRGDDLLVRLAHSGHSRQVDGVTSTPAHGDDLDRVGGPFVGQQSVHDTEALGTLIDQIELESSRTGEIAGDMPLAKLLAGLPPLGQIHDRLQGGIDKAIVLLAEKLKIQKDLRQKRPVERLSHDRSAEASGVPPQGSSDLVEAQPTIAGFCQSFRRLDRVEVVLDGGKQLQPERPREDHALGTSMASEGHRLRRSPLSLELPEDFRETIPGLSRCQHLAVPDGRHAQSVQILVRVW